MMKVSDQDKKNHSFDSMTKVSANKAAELKTTPQRNSLPAHSCLSLEQLCTPKNLSCTSMSVATLPMRQSSRSSTRLSAPPVSYSDSAQNNIEKKTAHYRHTPMPELNVTSFVGQPQSLTQHIIYGTSVSNSGALRKSGTPMSQSRGKRYSPFIASHSWKSTSGLGPLGEIGLTDHPTVMRFERMSLTTCPALDPEYKCEFLSLQRNRITRIDHLQRLTQLVFLDLSHNQVSQMSGLDQLQNLRVLLLGQNHIRRIEGLDQQRNLEVLDLQRNGIQKIENIKHLSKLRVLNLSMNAIVFLNGLSGLTSLTELNLRQNNIVKVEPLSNLPNLSWIQLSFNNIERWSQVSGLSKLPSTTRVVLDGNPIVMDPSYRRLMPTQLSTSFDNNTRRSYNMKRSTPQSSASQRGLGLINSGGQGADVYEMGQINRQMPSTPSWYTSHSEPDEPIRSYATDSGDPAAGDQNFKKPWTASSDTQTTAFESRIITFNLPTNCAKMNQSQQSPPKEPAHSTADSSRTCFDHPISIRKNNQTTPRIECTNRDNSTEQPRVQPKLITSLQKGTSKGTHISKKHTLQYKTENKVHRKTTTDHTFLSLQTSVRRVPIIRWHMFDRTHIQFEVQLYKEDADSSIQSIGSESSGFTTFSAALNYLTFASKTAERPNQNVLHATKVIQLSQVTQVTVCHVAWEDFLEELPQLRILFPELKCLNIKHMGIKRLIDIVPLVQLRRLNSLVVDPGLKNPIVRQAGQFWRPFVIWSLKGALNLRELDRVEITPEEVSAAATLFRGLGQALIAHARPYTTSNPGSAATRQISFGDTDSGADSQHYRITSPQLWGRDALWLHELDSETETRGSGIMNKWLSEANASWPHRTPAMLRGSGWDEEDSSEICSDSEDPYRFFIDEVGLNLFQSAAKMELPSTMRRLTVQHFLERVLKVTANRLVRESQTMNAWPSILRKLIERELRESNKITNLKNTDET